MLNCITQVSLSRSPLASHPAYASSSIKREELRACIQHQQRLVGGMCAVFLLVAGLSLWALAYQAQPTRFKVKHHPASPSTVPLMHGLVYESRHMGSRRIFHASELSPTLVGVMRLRQGTFGSQESDPEPWQPEEAWACTASIVECLSKTARA